MALTKITTSVVAANTLATANIADNSVDATKIASNSILTRHIDDDQITGDQLADNITIAGNLTITGNLTTNGSTVTNSSSNTTIEDAIIELGTGTSGAPATDAGIVIERGSSDNVFIGWDESADKVTVGTGSFTGASTGNLTITAAPFVSGALTASGISYPTSDGSAGQYLKTDGSGALSFGAVTTQVDNYTATGDGSTTAFDTGINPHNEVNTWIFIDGVYQQKSQYSYSGSTVTFSTAPENGALIDVVTGTTGGMASSDTVLGIYEATTTNTATYTTGISASNENNTWVFVGGVYQPKDSYTFSSGTLTFDANTPTGQKLSVVATKALTAGSVETTSLGANAVTAVKIASNSILSRHIANNSIVGADISATTGITAATFTGALTGNVTGNVAGNLTGTILTAAQTNITSVGTLSALTVSGQLTAGGIAYPTSDGSADQVLKTDGSGALSFGTVSGTTLNNNTNNYVMTGTGSANTLNGEANLTFDGLHLGMTSNHADHPSDANVLQLGGNAVIQGKSATGAGKSFRIMQNVYDDASAGLSYISTDEASHYTQVNGTHSFNVAASGNADAAITFKEAVKIDVAGNVGIGTTSPGRLLEVSHDANAHTPVLRLTGTSTSAYAAGLEWYSGYGPKETTVMYSTASGSQGGEFWQELRNQDTNTLKRIYHVNNTAKHTFYGQHNGDSTGHFLFTNSNHDAASTNCSLAVQNGYTFIQIMGWTSLGARIGTRTGGWTGNSGGDVYLTRQDATSIKLASSGPQLGNGTAISSDERLKENITDIADGQLAKICALTPRNFTWKDPRKTGTHEGFIAQEVEAVIPEAVFEDNFAPDPDDDSRDFEGDIKLIKHEVINARLIKAVQEQQTIIEDLKSRIETLEG